MLGVGVFILVANLLNIICKILQLIPNLQYGRYGKILTQFYVNFLRQEH